MFVCYDEYVQSRKYLGCMRRMGVLTSYLTLNEHFHLLSESIENFLQMISWGCNKIGWSECDNDVDA